jgi:hypothetical protein
MPTWDGLKIKRALKQKGFLQDEPTDHDYFRFYIDGKATSVRTKVSFGGKTKTEVSANSPLFTKFQNQLHLTNKELRDLFDCPMTIEQYKQLLIARGKVIPPKRDEPSSSSKDNVIVKKKRSK